MKIIGKKFGFSFALCILSSATVYAAGGPGGGGGPRACDTYIQKYCSGSSDHGPGCLKGHESDVSADCLKDMEHKGGGPKSSSDEDSSS